MMASDTVVGSVDPVIKCEYCSSSVKNRVTCKKCKAVFHPSCYNRAIMVKNPFCVHEKDTLCEGDIEMESSRNEFLQLVKKTIEEET